MIDPRPYRRLLVRLIYLVVTRSDLAFSVHTLSQFMKKPCLGHWNAVLRVIRYLKSDPGQGILLPADGDFHIIGWCDVDWASFPLTRRLVTGYIVQLGDSPIYWKTRKQPTVSRSSAEAKYWSIAILTHELLWLRCLLENFGVITTKPSSVLCDSKSAIYISTNPVLHERTKHVELDLHFVRDEVIRKTIDLLHVRTNEQLADILTKPIGRDGFGSFKVKLGLHNLYAPT